MPRLPRVYAPCGHHSYVRKNKRVCTFCEWEPSLKRARARYSDIANAAARWAVLFTRADFVRWYGSQIDRCGYCEITREEVRDDGSPNCSWHIDRVDSFRPYTLDNIVLACEDCNVWKSNRHSADEARSRGLAKRDARRAS